VEAFLSTKFDDALLATLQQSPQDNLHNIQINTNYETRKQDSATWLLIGYFVTKRQQKTVMILVNNQRGALFFHVCLFLFSTCFGQPCIHHQENSEVCHPRCAFKLYGEVKSVKKHNYNYG